MFSPFWIYQFVRYDVQTVSNHASRKLLHNPNPPPPLCHGNPDHRTVIFGLKALVHHENVGSLSDVHHLVPYYAYIG